MFTLIQNVLPVSMAVIRAAALKAEAATEADIENIAHYLDACDAGLVSADSLYMTATAKVTEYVAAKRLEQPGWRWRHPGAILDICENLDRIEDESYLDESANCYALG